MASGKEEYLVSNKDLAQCIEYYIEERLTDKGAEVIEVIEDIGIIASHAFIKASKGKISDSDIIVEDKEIIV